VRAGPDARVSERIKDLDARLKVVDEAIEELSPSAEPAAPSVPAGTSDADNVEVRKWGTPRTFSFEPSRTRRGEKLGLLDIERATKIAKSRFAVLWGAGAPRARAGPVHARLHTREHGYTELWLRTRERETMLKTGQLPKFERGSSRRWSGREPHPLPHSHRRVSLSALHGGRSWTRGPCPGAIRLHAVLPARGGHVWKT